MTNLQLYLAIGVPVVINSIVTVAGFITIYTLLNQRMTDLKDIWRAELRRVEDVLDARLKHLEEIWEK